MAWLFGAVVLVLVAVGFLAWNYPVIRSRLAANRRAGAFRQLAARLGTELLVPAQVDIGFLPTVKSIFGPNGDLTSIIAQTQDNETVYLLEYLYGSRRSSWAYKRGAVVVAIHLGKSVPMFTLQQPRGKPRSHVASDEVRGQRLTVQAVGTTHELWSTKHDKRRVKSMVGERLLEALHRDPGWDIRGSDEWLLFHNEKKAPFRDPSDLERFIEQAKQLRSLIALKLNKTPIRR